MSLLEAPSALSLDEIVARFRGRRVLVIGDAMLDTYVEGNAARLCAEGPVPVVCQTAEEDVPGGAANTATNLRALGAEVDFLGVVGSDPAGASLRAALHAYGVDDRRLVEAPEARTLRKLRILADDQYVVRCDAGETRRLSRDTQGRLHDQLAMAFAGCELVVVSDYGYGVLFGALIKRLTALRAARSVPLVVDSKQLHRFRAARATLITPNFLEARLAVGSSTAEPVAPSVPEAERLGHRLLERIDVKYAAITMGGAGVLLLDRTHALHHPAHPVARASDVGAGDSFTAAAALALAAGAAPADAVRIGIEAGGIAVTKRRTAVVRQQELLQRVSLDRTAGHTDLATVRQQLEEDRRHGRTIVFTNGVFDILHASHVYFLREARRLGDVLVVGVNTDEGARRLKGKNRPINRARDRMALVQALDPVDHVVAFDEDTPENLILALRPDIHVKGGDYAGEDLPEANAVRAVGGRIVILPLLDHVSTSQVIDRIVRFSHPGPGRGDPTVVRVGA